MRKRIRFPIYRQHDAADCGPASLRMIAKHYGKSVSLEYLREISYISRRGVSLLGISDAAEKIGFRTLAVQGTYEQLQEVLLPCIAHWKQNHFIVIYRINRDKVYVADPAQGSVKYSKTEFLSGWTSTDDGEGILLLLERKPDFHASEEEKETPVGFKFLFRYLFEYKKFLAQLVLGLLVGSVLSLVFPFLTQAIVDFGIRHQDLGFIYIILLAQLTLFASRASVELIRSRVLLHVGTRMNISIISDFLMKLMRLPFWFFDSRQVGDILQRIEDHRRIENLVTNVTLSTLFSLVNFVVFSVVLAIYNLTIFLIFLAGTVLSTTWILLFMGKRRRLDIKRFSQLAENKGLLIQLVAGMSEIKLNAADKLKRWEWERLQAKLFKTNIKSLTISQYQHAGLLFLNELKNIIVVFLVAQAVIEGRMTLGMMLAVSYIIGQLNAPITQFIVFAERVQDAKLGIERLAEIHNREEEEKPDQVSIKTLPRQGSINIGNLSFQYEGPHSERVLKDVDMRIDNGKLSAIVGSSGSGKTTLLKLMLKLYEPTAGMIRLDKLNLANVNGVLWRQRCGAVMQDGYIFSDTIAKNVALGSDVIDEERLLESVRVANIQEFIESLPLAYATKVGSDGLGLSQGQKQRLLIARVVYKNPDYIFFDEATNALDADNEEVIMRNLLSFFGGKTVTIVAHRLSTVRRADQIVVLDKGTIIERGTHEQLIELRGIYYRLVRNQLELGS